MPKYNPPFLDTEEKELIESFEEAIDEDKVIKPSEQEREEISNVWKQRVTQTREKKAITLRLQKRDITSFKIEAEKKGIPYQTLLASVVHQYANGDLVERK
ncbi:hypothetical protein N9J72_02400 [Candidatus Gracilibacteria bacterium]|nr:hypothetical protein [Candidatus Gracilibacteria bacterium]